MFFTNPRGSTGYGQKFQRGIELEWGGKDYMDIMNGVDAALQKIRGSTRTAWASQAAATAVT